jgi:hypothetical protein
MPFRNLLLPALLALVAAPGCMPPVEVPVVPQPTLAVFPVSKAKAWPAIVAVLGIEFPIQVIEKESGLITTRMSNMALPASQWAKNCEDARDFENPWNNLRMDLRLLAEEREPGKTQITLICHYEAFKQSSYPRGWTVVPTRGKLEDDLLNKIQARLAH